MRHKAVRTELKAIMTGSAPVIEGYCAVFNNVDLGGDVVMPGAFTKSLEQRGKTVPFIWSHNYSEIPIGKTIDLYEDEVGLFYRAELNGTELAAQVAKAVDHGDVNASSFGFSVQRESRRKSDGANLLHEVDIWECGPCIWGMNPLATSEMKAKQLLEVLEQKGSLWGAGYSLEMLSAARRCIDDALYYAQMEAWGDEAQASPETMAAIQAEFDAFQSWLSEQQLTTEEQM